MNSPLSSRIRDLESANSGLHDKLDSLRTTLEESNREREDLKGRISDLESEIETMRSQNCSIKGDLTRTAHVLPKALHLLQATKRVNITTSAENPSVAATHYDWSLEIGSRPVRLASVLDI